MLMLNLSGKRGGCGLSGQVLLLSLCLSPTRLICTVIENWLEVEHMTKVV